ncbi:shikimate dehydrogenase [Pricia antarctica]|uniref:Shikimate dehydrogenase n=1 Tax=Pricia antarctica TaxID=641691 RepID=A0A1G7E4X8_9FLAO|nr:shikimate dehydrogenase [Pricia antarctica]SDE58702.1 shikimate dehydrogenase [Pricia antarctica]
MKKYRFGLVGKNISYSFSKGYFTDKFSNLGLEGYSYENFDLQHIDELPELLTSNPEVMGLNVTIPFKQEVIAYLDELDTQAEEIGAVNTIKFDGKRLIGYNTDAYGFQKSIEPFLKSRHTKALILGTGGASKAIAFVLGQLGIGVTYVSRNPDATQIGYDDLTRSVLENHLVLVNCTPLGTYPNLDQKPDIPYTHITKQHLLFDLIYNPEKTAFLQEGKQRGADIVNGLGMLQLQADRAWEIWRQ